MIGIIYLPRCRLMYPVFGVCLTVPGLGGAETLPASALRGWATARGFMEYACTAKWRSTRYHTVCPSNRHSETVRPYHIKPKVFFASTDLSPFEHDSRCQIATLGREFTSWTREEGESKLTTPFSSLQARIGRHYPGLYSCQERIIFQIILQHCHQV